MFTAKTTVKDINLTSQHQSPVMPKLNYTLEDSLLQFFSSSGTSATRAQCDSFARQRYGGQIKPVPIQGMTSYTVTAGPNSDKIIHFREENALLDMNMLGLAKRIHEDLVPHCTFLTWFGSTGTRLAAYEMDKLGGDSYIMVRASLVGQHERQLATVYSLVRFFAQAWQNPVDHVDLQKISREPS